MNKTLNVISWLLFIYIIINLRAWFMLTPYRESSMSNPTWTNISLLLVRTYHQFSYTSKTYSLLSYHFEILNRALCKIWERIHLMVNEIAGYLRITSDIFALLRSICYKCWHWLCWGQIYYNPLCFFILLRYCLCHKNIPNNTWHQNSLVKTFWYIYQIDSHQFSYSLGASRPEMKIDVISITCGHHEL